MPAEVNSKIKRRERLTRYAPLFVWIGVIFFLSSGQASMSETSRFIRPLLEYFFPSALPETLTVFHGYIRKFAHFAEYAVVGLFAARAFSTSSIEFLKKYWFIFSLALVVSIAGLDEFNQSIGSSRTGSPWDVLLDFIGGAAAISFYYLIRRVWHDPRRH
ncbi:MAG: VanZ family protein [Saprospiraceae bacterium]|nr:VanZ family protein [Pyrinomonadaceae bacterium]